MSRLTHAAQIDLGFSHTTRAFLNFGISVSSCDFARERFHLFRQHWIGTNGQAQPVPESITRCASAAVSRSRASARARIFAVSLDLELTRHAAFSPLAGVVSIILSSSDSICCTLLRSISARSG